MIFYSDFLDSEDNLQSGSFCHFSVNDNYNFAKDGVHLNKKGHKKYSEIISKIIISKSYNFK